MKLSGISAHGAWATRLLLHNLKILNKLCAPKCMYNNEYEKVERTHNIIIKMKQYYQILSIVVFGTVQHITTKSGLLEE